MFGNFRQLPCCCWQTHGGRAQTGSRTWGECRVISTLHIETRSGPYRGIWVYWTMSFPWGRQGVQTKEACLSGGPVQGRRQCGVQNGTTRKEKTRQAVRPSETQKGGHRGEHCACRAIWWTGPLRKRKKETMGGSRPIASRRVRGARDTKASRRFSSGLSGAACHCLV